MNLTTHSPALAHVLPRCVRCGTTLTAPNPEYLEGIGYVGPECKKTVQGMVAKLEQSGFSDVLEGRFFAYGAERGVPAGAAALQAVLKGLKIRSTRVSDGQGVTVQIIWAKA